MQFTVSYTLTSRARARFWKDKGGPHPPSSVRYVNLDITGEEELALLEAALAYQEMEKATVVNHTVPLDHEMTEDEAKTVLLKAGRKAMEQARKEQATQKALEDAKEWLRDWIQFLGPEDFRLVYDQTLWEDELLLQALKEILTSAFPEGQITNGNRRGFHDKTSAAFIAGEVYPKLKAVSPHLEIKRSGLGWNNTVWAQFGLIGDKHSQNWVTMEFPYPEDKEEDEEEPK